MSQAATPVEVPFHNRAVAPGDEGVSPWLVPVGRMPGVAASNFWYRVACAPAPTAPQAAAAGPCAGRSRGLRRTVTVRFF